MTKDMNPGNSRQHGTASIPTESDWGNYQQDLDQKWAHDHYCGRSNEEMQSYVRNSPVEAASDLRFMPEVPFRYYMLGYRDFVMSRDPDNGWDAASCFVGLVLQKLQEQPRHIIPIMPELLPALRYVAHHQAEFEADESIYGSFLEKFERIHTLYQEARDRYRR